jgi:cold shock CspA family protein
LYHPYRGYENGYKEKTGLVDIMSSTDHISSARSIGYVKWFNKKQGFGFIHVLNGQHKDQDIFVHFSSIRVSPGNSAAVLQNGYKYLIQGEYVEFVVESALKENHKFHAVDITGVLENNILCHTRQENLVQRFGTGLASSRRPHSNSIASEEL